jgi:hypothetical protein
VLATLVVNKLRSGLKVAALKAPGFGDRRKAMRPARGSWLHRPTMSCFLPAPSMIVVFSFSISARFARPSDAVLALLHLNCGGANHCHATGQLR